MKSNYGLALSLVLKHEGGFVNHPKDPGGATNKGITIGTFRKFYGDTMTIEGLKNITDVQVGVVYKAGYWDKAHCDSLPNGVDIVVFDMAVNAGPSRSIKLLQKSLNVGADGVIGPETLKALSEVSTEGPDAIKELILEFTRQRNNFYRSLRVFDTFGKGWLRRSDATQQVALDVLTTRKPLPHPVKSSKKPEKPLLQFVKDMLRKGS